LAGPSFQQVKETAEVHRTQHPAVQKTLPHSLADVSHFEANQWHHNQQVHTCNKKWSITDVCIIIVCTYTIHLYIQKRLEGFEMWCCRRMEKISWTDHVRNEEVLLGVKEQIKGGIEVTGR
jgi:hypothetical protein